MIQATAIKIKQNYNVYCLALLFFCIPLWQKLSTVILIFLVVVSLFKFNRKKINGNSVILALLYFIYAIFEVVNSPIEFKILEMKAGLLAVPIIFYFNNYSARDVKKSYEYFIYGLVIACALCVINATLSSISFSNGFEFNTHVLQKSESSFLNSSMFGGNYYFGNNFSYLHQSVYFSMFLNIGLIILLFLKPFKGKTKLLFCLIFSASIFLISNRVNIFIFILIIFCWLLIEARFYNRTKSLFIIITVIAMSTTVLLTNPRTFKAIQGISNFKIDREANNSFGTRVLVWDAAFETVKRNLVFGVGPSNAYNVLRNVYKEKRYITPFRERLNAHNQYLQLLIETGVIGFIVLLIVLVLGFKVRINNSINIYITSIFLINCFFESILNRYSGIICFSIFMVSLFYIEERQNKPLISQNKE